MDQRSFQRSTKAKLLYEIILEEVLVARREESSSADIYLAMFPDRILLHKDAEVIRPFTNPDCSQLIPLITPLFEMKHVSTNCETPTFLSLRHLQRHWDVLRTKTNLKDNLYKRNEKELRCQGVEPVGDVRQKSIALATRPNFRWILWEKVPTYYDNSSISRLAARIGPNANFGGFEFDVCM